MSPRPILLLPILAVLAQGGQAQSREGTLETPDGVRLHYRIAGTGSPVLVVPLGAILAEPLAPLARQRTVVFYDMRGRGRSQSVDDPSLLGLEKEIQDLETIRRHLELDSMDLLGFSYLGAVSARYAARYPSRVRRLILAGPLPPRGPHPEATSPRELAELRDQEAVRELERLQSLDPEDVDPVIRCRTWWKSMLPLYVSPATNRESLMDRLNLACELPNERPEAFLSTLQGVLGDLSEWDWREEASGVTAPTLVVHGADDRTAPPAGGREWARAVPSAEFLAIEDAGHLLWSEKPARFLDAVNTFLERP